MSPCIGDLTVLLADCILGGEGVLPWSVGTEPPFLDTQRGPSVAGLLLGICVVWVPGRRILFIDDDCDILRVGEEYSPSRRESKGTGASSLASSCKFAEVGLRVRGTVSEEATSIAVFRF
jgi:hypothetical protein